MEDGKLTDASRQKVLQFVERVERLEEERREINGHINNVYAEAKAMGYDTKALRKVVQLRRLDRAEREEQEAMVETYLIAIGEV